MKKKWNIRRQISQIALLTAILPQPLFGITISKASNGDPLNFPTSWVGGVAPGSADIMAWGSAFTATAQGSLPLITADMSVAGITVTNPAGAANTANIIVGCRWDNTTRTITIGAGGIDMSAAVKSMRLDTAITLAASQTWNIANANTVANPAGLNNNEDLAMLAPALADLNLGSNTLTTAGAGQVTITSGYTVKNGTLNVGNNLFMIQGGSSRVTTTHSSLNLNVAAGAQLRLQSNTGALVGNAAISNSGTLTVVSNNSGTAITQSGNIAMKNASVLSLTNSAAGVLSIAGNISADSNFTWRTEGGFAHVNGAAVSGNLTGSGNISYQNSNTVVNGQTRLSGNNSGYAGTLTLNGTSGNRDLRLSTASAGSAAATWSVAVGNTLQVDGVSVQLGTLNGVGTVKNSHASSLATLNVGAGLFAGVIADGATATTALTKIGAGTLVLSGANSYSGTTKVTNGTLVMSTKGLGQTAVVVDDAATFRVDLADEDAQRAVPSVQLGVTTGSTLAVNLGSFTNPIVAPLLADELHINGASILECQGRNFTNGTFPLVAYGTLGGNTGLGGLTLKLPPRITGTLSNVSDTLYATITAVEGIRWKGAVNSNWDVDTTGADTEGTANWQTTVTNVATRFRQGSSGTDAARFDDLANGTGAVNVNLTTIHTPTSVVVENATRHYVFAGSGSLSGFTSVEKNGAASLQISNSSVNNYSGGTLLNEGSLILGDGITAGAGVIEGKIDCLVGSSLVLNRPDDHSFSNALVGAGTLVKNNANTVSFANAFSGAFDLHVNSGVMKFTNGANLPGVITGTGALEFAGGTSIINGAETNPFSGTTTVSGNVNLQLSNATGYALSGDLVITGTGRVTPTYASQLSPSSNISVTSTNSDSFIMSLGLTGEIVNNVLVNSATAGIGGGQLVMRNGMMINGTATVSRGVLGVASGQIANIQKVVFTAMNNTDAVLRVASNTGTSVMNIGSGGITASGGDWQVKFTTANFDAVVNLGGDVTTTGNFIITNGNYLGMSRNVLNLTGTRTFDIAAGTTTTVAPDFADDATLTADTEDSFVGNLVKKGEGKLVLNATCAVEHSGSTTVEAGMLIVNGTMPNLAPVVLTGAALGGSGTITAATTIATGATLAPGNNNAAVLNFGNDVTLSAGSTYAVDITSALAMDKISTPTGVLTVHGTIAVKLTGYTPVATDVFDIVDAATISGTPTFDFSEAVLPSGLSWDTTDFATSGEIKIKALGYQVFAQTITDPAKRAAGLDADSDGVSNLLEYVLAGDPTAQDLAILPIISSAGNALVITYKRSDASENDTIQIVQYSANLLDWTDVPITPAAATPVGTTVTIEENGAAADDVTVTIQKGTDKVKFARLKVTLP